MSVPTARVLDALTEWAEQAERDSDVALADDQIGRAARLRGKAEGLRLAVAEVRRAQR